MTGKDICNRAAECRDMKYWYGAKKELATVALANRLRVENPSTWTASYYAKAVKDCDGKTRVCDCSGLVCHAYGIGDISSYGIEEKYKDYHGDIKDGMILWRKGHVGIYEDGKVHELKGIDYDYQFNPYVPGQWTKILYDPNVQYEQYDYDTGWHFATDVKKWWYAYGTTKGSYYRNCLKEINGAVYAFDAEGYMLEGTIAVRADENGELTLA